MTPAELRLRFQDVVMVVERQSGAVGWLGLDLGRYEKKKRQGSKKRGTSSPRGAGQHHNETVLSEKFNQKLITE